MATYKTPGVYIDENNAFPGSVIQVATAIPVFIGFTERTTHYGKSVEKIPVRISSFKEYEEIFGGPSNFQFDIEPATLGNEDITDKRLFELKAKTKRFYLYHSMQLFYANGGEACYIVSVGNYSSAAAMHAEKLMEPMLDKYCPLDKESEPTLIVVPDALGLDEANCYRVYGTMLQHCERMRDRIAIFDVHEGHNSDALDSDIESFRSGIGSKSLNYSAAYYPWVHSSLIEPSSVNYDSLIGGHTAVEGVLTGKEKMEYDKLLSNFDSDMDRISKSDKDVAIGDINLNNDLEAANRIFHNSLLANCPTYKMITEEIAHHLNIMPVAAMMAGVYTSVDNNLGVWQAPANVSLSAVVSPTVDITGDQQEKINVDSIAGKSINAIRAFPRLGTLVWGARTLDGNSLDWRYINVRRTMIMLEQSIKSALHGFVFEPNVASTWITVKSMVSAFLTDIWKQGGLAGAIPADAFDVQVGLGSTMTSVDILEGKMIVTVKVAISRPAEFIVARFEQQMQAS